ncbi:MAG: hypothetical protein E7342_05440 [Clostridiales bacterium]|nr:hypothetical protein [Clostridiales bacterium]
MKKLSLVLLSLALAVCFLFAGCSKYGSIKRAYEDAGWTENAQVQNWTTQINTYLAEENREDITDTHVFEKAGLILPEYAIIVEFKSTESLVQAIEDSATLQGIIEDAQNSDYVSGNCLLIPIISSNNALEVFKTTK